MLVPGHVVALYVATGGQHGPGLGSDEKEVVLLVYVIIDVASESVSQFICGENKRHKHKTKVSQWLLRLLQ